MYKSCREIKIKNIISEYAYISIQHNKYELNKKIPQNTVYLCITLHKGKLLQRFRYSVFRIFI